MIKFKALLFGLVFVSAFSIGCDRARKNSNANHNLAGFWAGKLISVPANVSDGSPADEYTIVVRISNSGEIFDLTESPVMKMGVVGSDGSLNYAKEYVELRKKSDSEFEASNEKIRIVRSSATTLNLTLTMRFLDEQSKVYKSDVFVFALDQVSEERAKIIADRIRKEYTQYEKAAGGNQGGAESNAGSDAKAGSDATFESDLNEIREFVEEAQGINK